MTVHHLSHCLERYTNTAVVTCTYIFKCHCFTAHRITGKQEYMDALEPLLQKTGDYAIGFPTAIANGQIAVPECVSNRLLSVRTAAALKMVVVVCGRP